jgi:GntR family transcriptional regulator
MARTPLYKAAETEMIRRIEAGEWEVGKRLPNEFVLADEFKVSQGTMRRALMTLEGMGLLNRKPGRGTLVARPGPAASGSGGGARLLSDGALVAFGVHRAKSGLRGADAAEAALFGTGRLSHVERLLKRGGARAGTRISPSPKASRPRWTRTHRWTSQSSWARMGCGPPISPKRSAPTSRRCRNPSRSPATGTRRFWWSRAPPGTTGKPIARQVLRLIADGLSYG